VTHSIPRVSTERISPLRAAVGRTAAEELARCASASGARRALSSRFSRRVRERIYWCRACGGSCPRHLTVSASQAKVSRCRSRSTSPVSSRPGCSSTLPSRRTHPHAPARPSASCTRRAQQLPSTSQRHFARVVSHCAAGTLCACA
jgi:hypothetical protein